jgi:hypothetical protein
MASTIEAWSNLNRRFGMSIVNGNVVEVKLSRGMVTIIDATDADVVNKHKWYAHRGNTTFYARCGGGLQKAVLLHRMILEVPHGLYVDHINGDGLDNRRENLRLCTTSQNKHNGRKYRRPGGCSSVFKGVSRVVERNRRIRWRTCVTVNGTKYEMSFDTELSAARMYDELAREHFGEFAKTNFP